MLEELDAAVVRRIQDGTRLIPVLIDDVFAPAPLRHLRWVSVPALGLDGAVEDIAGTLFGSDLAPPLGSPPAYSRRTPQFVSNAVDDAVLGAAIDLILANGAGGYGAEHLLELVPDLDLSSALVEEAISSLAEQRIVEVERSFGGTSITRLKPRAWLAAMASRGLNVDELHDQLLAHFVNHSSTAGFDAADDETIDALVRVLELEGLIGRPSRNLNGTAHARVTVAGQRLAREFKLGRLKKPATRVRSVSPLVPRSTTGLSYSNPPDNRPRIRELPSFIPTSPPSSPTPDSSSRSHPTRQRSTHLRYTTPTDRQPCDRDPMSTRTTSSGRCSTRRTVRLHDNCGSTIRDAGERPPGVTRRACGR